MPRLLCRDFFQESSGQQFLFPRIEEHHRLRRTKSQSFSRKTVSGFFPASTDRSNTSINTFFTQSLRKRPIQQPNHVEAAKNRQPRKTASRHTQQRNDERTRDQNRSSFSQKPGLLGLSWSSSLPKHLRRSIFPSVCDETRGRGSIFPSVRDETRLQRRRRGCFVVMKDSPPHLCQGLFLYIMMDVDVLSVGDRDVLKREI